MVPGNSESFLLYANFPGDGGLMEHLSWNPKQRRVAAAMEGCTMGVYQPPRPLPWSDRQQYRKD